MNNHQVDYVKKQFKAKKAIILARVSSKEQEEGYSIDAQIHRLKTYCERQNLSVINVYEIVESSTNGDRKQFMDMIKFAKKQKETIALVADKVDRVQRSFKDYPLLDALIQENKLELHFNTENYIIHKDSVSQERLMWSMGVIMAQSYVDNLRDNVKRSIDHKIRLGEWIALAPLGYLNTKDSKMRGDIVIDPTRSEIIIRMFEEFAKGASTLGEIRNLAIKLGLKNRTGKKGNITKSQVHQILRNPFYYGKMKIKDRLYIHRYPPLITKELYDQCQAVLYRWNKKPFKFGGKEFLFRGLLMCSVSGKVVTADTKTKTYANGKKSSWTYLRYFSPSDPNKPRWVREEEIVKQAVGVLSQLNLDAESVATIQEHIKSSNKKEKDFARNQFEELGKQLNLVQDRLDKLMDLFLDGTITRSDFERKKLLLSDDKDKIEKDLSRLKQPGKKFSDAILELLTFIRDLKSNFESSNISEKRKLLNTVFSNLHLKGTTLCFSLRKPFDQFIKCVTFEDWRALLNDLRTNQELKDEISQVVSIFIFTEDNREDI